MSEKIEKLTTLGYEFWRAEEGIWFMWKDDSTTVIKDELIITELEKLFKENTEKHMSLLDKYQEFAQSTISDASSNFDILMERLEELNENEFGILIPQLMTAEAGLTAEAGEFGEVVKKILYQGKPLDEESIYHLKRELGDILWYVSAACDALDFTIKDCLMMNIEKLSARYPQGFEIIRSEVRSDDDI